MPLRKRPYYLLRQLLRQQVASGLQNYGSAATRPRAFASVSSLHKQQDGGNGGRPNEITSIFRDLFPDFPDKERRETGVTIDEAREAGVRLNDDGDGDDALQWLRTIEDGGLLASGTDGGPDVFLGADDGTERSEPTVLVLSGATASLLPSDFFRIAPRTARQTDEHVDGWAAAGGGLYKIVQDRDPATLTPRGRYFLYFGAPAAALAYAQEVRDLHGLARRAVQAPRHRNMARFREAAGSLGETPGSGWGWGRGWVSGSAWGSDWDQRRERHVSEGGGGSGGGSDGSFGLAEEAAAALRSFSLLPPTAKLDLAMHLPDRTPATAEANKDGDDEVAAADTQTRVLLVLEDTSGGGSDHGSDGGVTSIDGLRALIEADGEARNLPWAVSDGLNGVVPVRWLVEEQRRLREEEVAEKRRRQEERERAERERKEREQRGRRKKARRSEKGQSERSEETEEERGLGEKSKAKESEQSEEREREKKERSEEGERETSERTGKTKEERGLGEKSKEKESKQSKEWEREKKERTKEGERGTSEQTEKTKEERGLGKKSKEKESKQSKEWEREKKERSEETKKEVAEQGEEQEHRSRLSSTPSTVVPELRAKTDQMNEHASFSRFVVTLPDPIEARRFVRSWHRRTVTVPTATDSEAEATAVVEATVLW